ncbi:DUF928 domain-containing protein [aff. Roholtiella sp. LEGE 12411]|uniref:DUF928 domain-containing protein n=1 Tax=aff. Roholtiella sp. LEGE 12411 TaxID=1828822 RepID=UPI001FC8E9C2|nr:DUF928 domain-containing protein [aff. Roholtiella sp. LEGE 12411]
MNIEASPVHKNISDKVRKIAPLVCSSLYIYKSEMHPMMTYKKWTLHKLLNFKILTTCILSTTLSTTQIALAGYQPPSDQKPPSGYSDSSGVRGRCKATSGRSLTLLAPITHVGRTTSLHPTFAWFIPDNQAVRIQFSLYEFDTSLKPKKLNIYTQQFQSSQGMMKRSLPQKLPGLSVGKRYLWQLQTLCNSNRPSRNPVSRAEIEVVQIPQALLTALSVTKEPSLRANLYAEAGIWYDAINEVLPTSGEQTGRAVASLLTSLAKLEKTGQSRHLSNIAMSNAISN